MGTTRERAAAVALAILAAVAARAEGPRALDSRKALTQLGLETWTTDQGLPNATVNAVLQTRDGYLWLGTYDGLARFDGVGFTIFDKRNTPGMSVNDCFVLHEDSTGAP